MNLSIGTRVPHDPIHGRPVVYVFAETHALYTYGPGHDVRPMRSEPYKSLVDPGKTLYPSHAPTHTTQPKIMCGLTSSLSRGPDHKRLRVHVSSGPTRLFLWIFSPSPGFPTVIPGSFYKRLVFSTSFSPSSGSVDCCSD